MLCTHFIYIDWFDVYYSQENIIEFTKDLTRSRKSKEGKYNGQKKKDKATKKIYKTLHRKLKIEQQEPH
jgi:hypothetical protein